MSGSLVLLEGVISDSLKESEAKELREVSLTEQFQALDLPVFDETAGVQHGTFSHYHRYVCFAYQEAS